MPTRDNGREKVFWGAGAIALRLLRFEIDKNSISFFVDKHAKEKKSFLGKQVVYPEDVEDWNRLFVYVPYTIYEEVRPLLLSKGLEENVDFVSCGNFDVKMFTEENENDVNRAIENLRLVSNEWRHSIVCFFDRLLTFKLYTDFLVQLRKNNVLFHIITHDYWGGQVEIEKAFGTDSIIHPKIFHARTCISDDNYLQQENWKKIKDNSFFQYIAAHIYQYTSQKKSIEECYYQTGCLVKYLDAFFEYIRPSAILCSTTVTPPHALLAYMCRQRNIPIISTHEGIIPGTLAFDLHGREMGASLPAIYQQEFQKLSVSEAELKKARDVWHYLFKSKLNRKLQPDNDIIKKIKKKINFGRPIIFFAGQNDTSSNMVPYTETTCKYHSPIFKSSTEAAAYIAHICVENDWNFIYKPHPMYIKQEQIALLPANTIFLERGDINKLIDIADVTITILSATSYNALTRYKPVVMLGYTQLRGKGCTYEAFEKDRIEAAIKEALEKGFAKDQQEAFLKHMAQCLKYYLYDDLQEKPIRYGRSVPKGIDEFYELERLLVKKV